MLYAIVMLRQAAPAAPAKSSDTTVTMTMDAAFFRTFDTDHDGMLNLAEFQVAMDSQFIRAIDAYRGDKPDVKKIDWTKVHEGMAERFRTFDVNSDGLLAPAELLRPH